MDRSAITAARQQLHNDMRRCQHEEKRRQEDEVHRLKKEEVAMNDRHKKELQFFEEQMGFVRPVRLDEINFDVLSEVPDVFQVLTNCLLLE
jgi:hypothetical protein